MRIISLTSQAYTYVHTRLGRNIHEKDAAVKLKHHIGVPERFIKIVYFLIDAKENTMKKKQ